LAPTDGANVLATSCLFWVRNTQDREGC
jgi:hypothetical protein